MSVIPEQSGHETEVADGGLGLILFVLLVLAVVTALAT
jgi:hypothetical protein